MRRSQRIGRGENENGDGAQSKAGRESNIDRDTKRCVPSKFA